MNTTSFLNFLNCEMRDEILNGMEDLFLAVLCHQADPISRIFIYFIVSIKFYDITYFTIHVFRLLIQN